MKAALVAWWLLAAAAQDPSPCDRPELVPADKPAPKWQDARALLDAACGPDCVVECREGGADQGRMSLFSRYDGSFRCPGRLESIVSLFPCDDAAGMHGVAGSIVFMQAVRPPGKAKTPLWEKADAIEGSELGSGSCRKVPGGDTDNLACLDSWGPYQGISGQSLCVYLWDDGFQQLCPLRVEDNCNSGLKPAWAAEVKGWTVGTTEASGVTPVRVTIRRSDCAGKASRTLEAVVLMEAAGARLSPQTEALLKKTPVSSE
jgi:hypothetical protein